MAKKLSKLQLAQQKAEAAAKKTNKKINELGIHASDLYAALAGIQGSFDRIRNVPDENRITYEKLKAIRVNWKQQAEKIEQEYKKAEIKAAGQGAAGVGAGVAVGAVAGSCVGCAVGAGVVVGSTVGSAVGAGAGSGSATTSGARLTVIV